MADDATAEEAGGEAVDDKTDVATIGAEETGEEIG